MKSEIIVAPELFSGRRKVLQIWEPGLSLAEIAARIDEPRPAVLFEHGVAFVNGDRIWPEQWHMVRPKYGTPNNRTVVQFFIVPHGGGRILQLAAQVALIGLTSAAFAIGGPLAAGVVGYAGQFAINALLVPPPKQPKTGRESISAGISGNQARPGDLLQRIVGKVHYSPPYLAAPFSYLSGQDVYVEGVVGLYGNHQVTNIKVNGSAIEENETIEDYEVREGTQSGADLDDVTICAKTVYEDRPGQTLSNFHLRTKDGERDKLYNQTNPDSSKSKWASFSMRHPARIFRVRCHFPQGLHDSKFNNSTGMPMRLRIRKRGETAWRNMPEFHWQERFKIGQEYRQNFTFIFDTDPGTFALEDNTTLATYALWKANAGIGEWLADNYFVTASPGGLNSAGHVYKDVDGFTIYLESDQFPIGEYEIQAIRGLAYSASGNKVFNANGYTYNGDHLNCQFFDYKTDGGGVHRIYLSDLVQTSFSSEVVIESVTTESDDYPLPDQNDVPMTLIAVKAKNGNISSISADFYGRSETWNGVDWNTVAVTKNPAAHFREIARSSISKNPYSATSFDTVAVEDWYDYCTTEGLECNAVLSGPMDEMLSLVASAGHATPNYGDQVSVVVEHDRSADTIMDVLTPLNSRNLRNSKPFDTIPHGIYAVFSDEDDDYRDRQETVYGDGYDSTNATLFQRIEYRSITTVQQAQRRALIDWRQLYYRQIMREIDAGAEHFAVNKGSLILLNHDVVSEQHLFGLIASVTTSAGNVVSITLEEPVDLALVGGAVGVAIRTAEGTILEKAITETGYTSTLTFSTPFADPGDLEEGQPVGIGPVASQSKRVVIHSIRRANDLEATLSLVDEAPEIHAASGLSLNFSLATNSTYIPMVT
jgi:hypothetical protein